MSTTPRTRTAKRAAPGSVIMALAVALLVSCSDGPTEGSPEDVVREMLEARKAGDWEKAAECIDVEGMTRRAEKMVREAPDEMKEELERALEAPISDTARFRRIDEMKKEAAEGDFDFEIVETIDRKEGSATVVVDVTTGGKTTRKEFPVVKVDGEWKVGLSDD